MVVSPPYISFLFLKLNVTNSESSNKDVVIPSLSVLRGLFESGCIKGDEQGNKGIEEQGDKEATDRDCEWTREQGHTYKRICEEDDNGTKEKYPSPTYPFLGVSASRAVVGSTVTKISSNC